MVDFRDYFDISYDDEITCDLCNKTWDGKDFGAPDGMYHLMSAHGIESSFESKASEGLDFFEKDNIIDDSPMEEQLYGLFDEEGGDGRNEWPQIRRDFCNGNTDIESLVSGVSNQRSARGIKSILRWADKIFKSNESKANEGLNECTNCDGYGKEECDNCIQSGNSFVVRCPECDGYGKDDNDDTCGECGGDGEVLCDVCDNTGEITCNVCGGIGEVNESKANEDEINTTCRMCRSPQTVPTGRTNEDYLTEPFECMSCGHMFKLTDPYIVGRNRRSGESKANEEIEYTGGDYCGKCGTEFEDKGECKKCDGESKASETQDDFDWLNEDDDRFTATMWEQSDGTWIVNSEGSQYDSSFTARFTDSVDAHKYMDKVNRGELTKDDLYNDEMSGYRILESKANEGYVNIDDDGFYNPIGISDVPSIIGGIAKGYGKKLVKPFQEDKSGDWEIQVKDDNGEWKTYEYGGHYFGKDGADHDAKNLSKVNRVVRKGSGYESKASESISDSDKQILGDWVSQNRDWTTIDDLPNEIFVPLMAPFGDDTDKRVEAQVEIINYMKSLGESDMVSESWSQKSSINRIEALERIGVKQGDAIKLSSLEFEDFGEDLQGALKGDFEDARREMKSDKDTLDKTDPLEPSYSFQWQQGGEVENPNSEFDQSYPDYNNIGESQTNMTSYECELCDSGFKSNEALSVHHNDKHAISPESFDGYANEGEGLPYAMGDYTDWFSQAWGDDADQSAIPNTVQCEYCFDQFNVEDQEGMISHINSKHDADVDPVNGDTNKSWGESKASEKTGYRKRPTGHGTYVYEEKSKINCQNCDKEIYETDGDTFHTTKCRYCGHVNLTNDLTYEAKASAKENMEAEAMVWYDSLSYSDKIELNITDEAKGYSGQELKDSTFSGNRNIDDAWSNIESYFISKNYDNQGLGDEQDNAAGGSWDGNHMGKSNNTWVGSMMHDNLVTTDPNQAKHGNMGGQLNWTYKGESKASEDYFEDEDGNLSSVMKWKLVYDDGSDYGFQTDSKAEAQRAVDQWNHEKLYSDRSIKIVSQESKASEVSIDDFKRIVDNHQYEKLTFDDGKVLIDAFVASAIVQLYDQLNDAQKQQFDGIVRTSTGVDKLLSIAFKASEGDRKASEGYTCDKCGRVFDDPQSQAEHPHNDDEWYKGERNTMDAGLNAIDWAKRYPYRSYGTYGSAESKASEFNIGTTMICPICKKEIETGNEDSFYHKSNFYDPNSVPMSYKMQNHFEQEHTPEDFGVQNKNFKGASGGYEAFGDWKTGNQLSLAFRNSFPEYNQDDSTMMNNADKHSTLDSDGNRMPDDYEGESKASEADQEIITRLEQGRDMFEADVDTSLWDLAHGIFIEFKLSSMDEAEKITKDWYFSTTDTGYYKESTDKFEADIENDQVVQKLPDDKRSFDVEAGAEDHGCAECGFTTSDNSEYIDHLNSHEV